MISQDFSTLAAVLTKHLPQNRRKSSPTASSEQSKMTTAINVEWTLLEYQNNITALREIHGPTWVDTPQIRGTATILWSCLLTLLACVYTVLHLNVPARKGGLKFLRNKILWMLAALAAPEVLVYTASSQFFRAWRLRRELRKLARREDLEIGRGFNQSEATLRGSLDGDDSLLRQHVFKGNSAGEGSASAKPRFDLRYCFFVVMGGVEVAVPGQPGKTLCLQDKAVLLLAELGHFVSIPASNIDDKSKASILQKAVVIIQVSWMVIQCISRAAHRLPLALLEVHTMVHVVCASFLYALWLKVGNPPTFPRFYARRRSRTEPRIGRNL